MNDLPSSLQCVKWGDAGSLAEGGAGAAVPAWSGLFRGEWAAGALSDGLEDTSATVPHRTRVPRADG